MHSEDSRCFVINITWDPKTCNKPEHTRTHDLRLKLTAVIRTMDFMLWKIILETKKKNMVVWMLYSTMVFCSDIIKTWKNAKLGDHLLASTAIWIWVLAKLMVSLQPSSAVLLTVAHHPITSWLHQMVSNDNPQTKKSSIPPKKKKSLDLLQSSLLLQIANVCSNKCDIEDLGSSSSNRKA